VHQTKVSCCVKKRGRHHCSCRCHRCCDVIVVIVVVLIIVIIIIVEITPPLCQECI
jgi:hypothetical protein